MFYKVKSVQPLPDMMLHVVFVNGDAKKYNVKPLMNKWEVFKDLAQDSLFKIVQVDASSNGIAWNEYIDLACNELWENGLDDASN
jgi:hypothetical protein